MPQGVKRAIGRALEGCEHYPDPLCRRLARAVADKEGVPKDRLIFGNGAADLIFRLTAALKPKNALIPAPTFAEYEQALRQPGAAWETLPFVRETDLPWAKGFFPS